jgi:nitroimidazol reductase NimA-like FMN-containing flavoprotein (pyridoxamine 5'-phosphate oxidase superfamily)
MSALPRHVAALLEEATIVRVATVAADGAPNVAPFWFHYDGTRIVLDTLENGTVRNIRREPRVAVLVDAGARFEELRTATIAGRARAFVPDEAPPEVADGVEAIRLLHADELTTPVFEEYAHGETRASVYVEIAPADVRWWSPIGT